MSYVSNLNFKSMLALVKGYIDKLSSVYVKKAGDTMTGVLKSTVASGTAPFKVASDTKIENLNSDMVDGKHAEDFLDKREDGLYPEITAGNAGNLQGNNEIVSSSAYHPTGGNEDVLFGTAKIENIKGNAVAWNQLVKNGNFAEDTNWDGNNVEYTISNNVISVAKKNVEESAYVGQNVLNVLTSKHKYIFCIDCRKDGNAELIRIGVISGYPTWVTGNITSSWNKFYSIIDVDSAPGTIPFFRLYNTSNNNDTLYFRNAQLFDLTLIYGAGNEPSTPEQFEADYQRWFGKTLEYEEYDEGSIRPVLATGIKTVGFNLYGGGDFEGSVIEWNSKNNPNKILWNNDCGYIGQVYVQYDFEGPNNKEHTFGITLKNRIVDKISTIYGEGKVMLVVDYIDGYSYIASVINAYNSNTDTIKVTNICVNMVWSGKRNGDYEPYWEETQPLPITELTSNGVKIFPDGLKRVDDIYDEIFVENGITKAIKRVISVDLGTLDWKLNLSNDNNYFVSNILTAVKKTLFAKAICSKYSFLHKISGWSNLVDKSGGYHNTTIIILDNSFEDAEAFKQSLQGVLLYLEIKEPETYIIDNFNLPVVYKIDDFGTEQILMPENSITPIITSRYGINAVDAIRNLSRNYLGKKETAVAAEKLAKPVRIFGQEFDGTQDVGGGGEIQELSVNRLNVDQINLFGVISEDFNTLDIDDGDSIGNIPTSNHKCIIYTYESGTIGFGENTWRVTELHLIIENTGSNIITINIPSQIGTKQVKSNGVESINIDPGNYGEINILNLNNYCYVRAI